MMWTFIAAPKMAVRWLSLIILWNSPAFAEGFFTKLSSGAYLGREHLMGGYTVGDSHDFGVGFGRTETLKNQVLYQINLEYRLQTFKDVQTRWPNFVWRPLQLYVTASHVMNRKFFIHAPEQYPSDDYYEITALAFFFGLGSEFAFKIYDVNASFFWWVNTNDRYLLAKANNPKWHTEFCCSSGIGLKLPL